MPPANVSKCIARSLAQPNDSCLTHRFRCRYHRCLTWASPPSSPSRTCPPRCCWRTPSRSCRTETSLSRRRSRMPSCISNKLFNNDCPSSSQHNIRPRTDWRSSGSPEPKQVQPLALSLSLQLVSGGKKSVGGRSARVDDDASHLTISRRRMDGYNNTGDDFRIDGQVIRTARTYLRCDCECATD